MAQDSRAPDSFTASSHLSALELALLADLRGPWVTRWQQDAEWRWFAGSFWAAACAGCTFSMYWQNATKGSGVALPLMSPSSLRWGRVSPDCNPDVRKSMGCTVGYPRDISHLISRYLDLLFTGNMFVCACFGNRNFLLCLDQTATGKMTVSTLGSFQCFLQQ